MKITNKILGSVALATILAFSVTGCGSDDDNNTAQASKTRLSYLNAMGISFEKDMTALTTAWTSTDDEEATAINAFKAKSVANASSDLIQGCIDIATEVYDGKIADPLAGTGHADFDTTKVESQFSWNSSADFYNNIYSIKKVWDKGLKNLAIIVGADTSAVDIALASSLTKLASMSSLNAINVIAGTENISQENAFRNRMQTAAGNAAIVVAQSAIEVLNGTLEDVQATINANHTALNELGNSGNIYVNSVADTAIKATYTSLGTNATALMDAITALKTTPSATTVTAARDAWKLVRANWESSEAYIVATSPSLGAATDGNTDSWPVTSQAAIEANLDAWDGDIFTIVNTDGETKGFHTIEYLLFGSGKDLESAAAAATRLSAN